MEIITNKQFAFLMLVFITSTADIFLPSITVNIAGRDAWLSVAAAALAGSVIVIVQSALASRFPGKPLTEYAGLLLGPVAGNMVILAYLFFILFVALAVIGELGQIINTVFLRHTPLLIISTGVTLAAAYAVFLGFETLTRVIELAFPAGIIIRLTIVLFILGDVNIIRYQPVLEQGPGPVLQGALRVTGWLGEGVILLFLSQHIKSPEKFMKTMLAVIWSVAMVFLLGFLSIGTFGPRTAGDITFPLLEMMRIMQFGSAQGLEALIMIFWYSATFIKICVLYYILTESMQNLVKTRSRNPLIFPLGLLLAVLPVVLFSETAGTLDFLRNVWPGFALFFELLLPATLLLWSALAGVKHRGGRA